VASSSSRNTPPPGRSEIRSHPLSSQAYSIFALEVVAEREVSEHLEEGVVARRAADVLQIVVLARHPHALLGGGRARVGPLLLAEEDALEGDHPGVGEEQRCPPARAGAGRMACRYLKYSSDVGSRQQSCICQVVVLRVPVLSQVS
jgi:hypothetical protein